MWSSNQPQPGKPTPLREACLPIHPVSVYRIDDKYIAERNLPGGRTLAGLRIVLVGCGTIGGYLAEMLVKAGAGTARGQLTLVDMGSMEPNNLGRHRLGSLHCSSARPLRCAKSCSESPQVPMSWISAATPKMQFLASWTLLIDATGEQGRQTGSRGDMRRVTVSDNGLKAQVLRCAPC
jgi:hypothetical protein